MQHVVDSWIYKYLALKIFSNKNTPTVDLCCGNAFSHTHALIALSSSVWPIILK